MHISWGILNPSPEIRAAIEKEIIKMKKILAMTMALAMSLSLVACGGNGTTSSTGSASSTAGSSNASASQSGAASTGNYGEFTTVEEGKLIMSTNAQFPPYEMVATDGSYEGIDIEVAGAIAEKLGLELVVDNMGFDAALQAAQQGKSDMVMAGVTVNDERLQVMDFSDTYATGVQVVIVKEGSDVTLDNLGEKMIGCQMATTGYIYCSAPVEEGGYGEDHVTAYEDGAVAVQALVNGQVDAVVIDNLPAQAYVEANPGLTILDTEYANEDYAIGVAKGNTALLNAINTALAELTEDGTVQSIIDKYIPAE